MRWQRRSTTTRGLTLIEVLVTSAILSGMSLVLMSLLTQNQRSSQKAIHHSDTSAQVTLVQEKLRLEMRGSRVIGLSPRGALQYWRCQLQAGLPQLDSQGRPNWLPGSPADPEVAELAVEKGYLRRSFQGQLQAIAPVGPDGALEFHWNAGTNILTVSGNVGMQDPFDKLRDNLQPFCFQVCLSNLE